MAQRNNSVVQEGVAQIRTAVRRVDRELRKLQREVETRRKQVTKKIDTRRKATWKRAQKEITRLQKEISRQPLVKRAESLRAGARTRIEDGFETVFGALPVASRRDVERIDRKLRSIDRKLRELEKVRPTRAASPSKAA